MFELTQTVYSYVHSIQLAIYHIIIHFACITIMYETMQRRIGMQTHEYILKRVHVLQFKIRHTQLLLMSSEWEIITIRDIKQCIKI